MKIVMNATSNSFVSTLLCSRHGTVILALGWLVACSSTSKNDNQSGTGGGQAGGGTAGLDSSVGGSAGASGSPLGGSGGVEPDAATGGSAGAATDAGPQFDAGTCTGDPLVEYDFAVCGGGCLIAGLCATVPACGTNYVCSFDGFDNTAPAEYNLPLDGVCSGKLVFTSQGTNPAKLEFFGIDSNTGNEVVLKTLTSEMCITPGQKSFLLPAPATKVVLSVPYQTTAYLDNVELNQ
jgi:hypothetical protein